MLTAEDLLARTNSSPQQNSQSLTAEDLLAGIGAQQGSAAPQPNMGNANLVQASKLTNPLGFATALRGLLPSSMATGVNIADKTAGYGADAAMLASPLGDAGAALRLGGAALNRVPVAGKIVSSFGNLLNPANANGLLGMMGRGVANGALSGGAIAGATGQDPTIGATLGGGIGGVGGGVTRVLASGPLKAISQFKPIKTVQDWVANKVGGAQPNEIANKTVGAINELNDNAQEISGNSFDSIMKRADQMGIDASQPINTWSTGKELASQVANYSDKKYDQLKNDIDRAQNLFRDVQGINPATGQIMRDPVSFQRLNNFKKEMYDKGYKTGQDEFSSAMYKQLGQSVSADLDKMLENTPLGAEFTSSNKYFQDHVLPLRKAAAVSGSNGLRNHVLNEQNSDFTKAISPAAGNSPIEQAHNAMLSKFQQTYNTNPIDLIKGFLISAVNSDKNIIDPYKTIKNYNDMSLNGATKHLHVGDANGNPPLYTHNDRIDMGRLATQTGYFKKPINAADMALQAAAVAGKPVANIAKKSADVITKYLPHAVEYMENPIVKNALLTGGIPAAEKEIRNLIGGGGTALGSLGGSPLQNVRNLGVRNIPSRFGGLSVGGLAALNNIMTNN